MKEEDYDVQDEGKITAANARMILERGGRCVTLEEAEAIARFMYFIVALAINQYMNQDGNSGSIHQSKY